MEILTHIYAIFRPYGQKLSVIIRYFLSAKICLFLSVFMHKRPSPFFYTYPTKKPSFKLINDQFIVVGICYVQLNQPTSDFCR